ncbi:MAG: hypothetical protein AB1540_03205 [Bdellovibrionota bacterium]
MAKPRRNLFILVGICLVLLGFIAKNQFFLATHKPFWDDEAIGINSSCTAPYFTLLSGGAPSQCSPQPLYYLLNKWTVSKLGSFDHGILWKLRLEGLIASTLLIAVVFLSIGMGLGLPWALLSIVLMNNQPLFHQYAAETRPYAVWLFFFGATTLLGARLSSKGFSGIRNVEKGTFAALSLGLTLVAGPGMFQVFVTSFWCMVCWHFFFREEKTFRKTKVWMNFLAPLAFVSLSIGMFYSLKSCNFTDAGPYDLLLTKDFGLIRSVWALFWPSGSLITVGFNALVVLGAAYPVLAYPKRRDLSSSEKFAFSLAVISILQLGLAVFLGLAVALKHYYFVQRIFIYLILCRAFLAAVGGFYFYQIALKTISKHSRQSLQRAFKTTVLLGASSLAAASLFRLPQLMRSMGEPRLVQTGSSPRACGLKLGKNLEFYAHPENFADPYPLNFLAMLEQEIKQCGQEENKSPQYIVALKKHEATPDRYYAILSSPPRSEATPLLVCGRPVRAANHGL